VSTLSVDIYQRRSSDPEELRPREMYRQTERYTNIQEIKNYIYRIRRLGLKNSCNLAFLNNSTRRKKRYTTL